MENVLLSLNSYGKWSVKSSRSFNSAEVACVKNATVVDSQFGKSVCFAMVDGSTRFIPLSNKNENTETGTQVNVSEAKLVVLSKPGADDIMRVEI